MDQFIELNSGFDMVSFKEDFSEVKNPNSLIQLKPYGITLASERTRPVMILKDETGRISLPVPISPIEAGVTLSQSTKNIAPATPHKVTEVILGKLGVKIGKCIFTEIRGHHLYVELEFSGNAILTNIKVRADEAMSLCVQLAVPIFASEEFINKSRVLQVELSQLNRNAPVKPDINQNYII